MAISTIISPKCLQYEIIWSEIFFTFIFHKFMTNFIVVVGPLIKFIESLNISDEILICRKSWSIYGINVFFFEIIKMWAWRQSNIKNIVFNLSILFLKQIYFKQRQKNPPCISFKWNKSINIELDRELHLNATLTSSRQLQLLKMAKIWKIDLYYSFWVDLHHVLNYHK